MNYKQFTSTWLSLQASNRFLKICCVLLIALNFVALIGWLNKERMVILIPPDLSKESEIARNKASEGYKKAWGMYTASLIGNVTPDNADFILESFKNMVTSEIRSQIIDQVMEELDSVKQEKISSVFEITQVAYEPESDKVFVTGRNRMMGAGGSSPVTNQTFEFTINVKNYSPIITQMASYPGQPKFISTVEAEEKKKKREEDYQQKINSTKH